MTRVAARFVALVLVATAFAVSDVARADRPEAISGGDASIVDTPVSFDVVNRNGSAFPCRSDGREYTVHGHVTGPRSDLEGTTVKPRVISVLLTGFDEGEWTWRFRDVPGYDYPFEMAKFGHTSLSLDMLGFGASGRPQGDDVCWGSQADVNHQIVQQLRRGTYDTVEGVRPVRFSTVLVSAHDSGPAAALIHAYTWPKDIDGISTQIWAHQGFTPYIIDLYARRNAACALGGQRADDPNDNPDDPLDDPSRGGGYMLYGPPDEQFARDLFYEKRADPKVIEAVVARRRRNPCGHITTVAPVIRRNLTGVPGLVPSIKDITVPVLLIFPGPDDPVIDRDGQASEAANFTGSDDVTTVWMDSGHFMELETCAPSFRAFTASWIHARWHVGRPDVAPRVGSEECVAEVRRAGA
jgi:hypothetical protein